jgi:hypothetical protein
MQLRFEWLALYVAVAALYLLIAWREWAGLRPAAGRVPFWLAGALIIALVLHGGMLWHGMVQSGELRFGFAHALSASLWITALIVCVETFFSASRGMFLLVLPLTAVASVLPLLFPGTIVGRTSALPLFQLHLLFADYRSDPCIADGNNGAAPARRSGSGSRAAGFRHRSLAAIAGNGTSAIQVDHCRIYFVDCDADKRHFLL